MNLGGLPKPSGLPVDSFTRSLTAHVKSGNELDKLISGNLAIAAANLMQNVESEDISAMGQAFRPLRIPNKRGVDEVRKVFEMRPKVFERKDADGFADQFSGRDGNKEYHLDPLILSALAYDVGDVIHEDLSLDQIIALVEERMQDADPAMVDKAFEFLVEIVQTQSVNPQNSPEKKAVLENISEKIAAAKEQYFNTGNHAVAIRVAGKIIGAVDAVVNATGLSINETLGRYRDIVASPPDLQTLRKYYEANGGTGAMRQELLALGTYINVHIKRTGDLENAELGQLAKTSKLLQGLFGVTAEANNQCKTFLPAYLKANGLIEVY